MQVVISRHGPMIVEGCGWDGPGEDREGDVTTSYGTWRVMDLWGCTEGEESIGVGWRRLREGARVSRMSGWPLRALWQRDAWGKDPEEQPLCLMIRRWHGFGDMAGTEGKFQWVQARKKVRKHKHRGQKFGVEAMKAVAEGRKGGGTELHFRSEWRYCSLRGRSQAGGNHQNTDEGGDGHWSQGSASAGSTNTGWRIALG